MLNNLNLVPFRTDPFDYHIKFHYKIWGGRLDGGANFEWDPFDNDPKPYYFIRFSSEW